MTLPLVARPYLPLARMAQNRHKVPAELILAVISQESGFRATAYRAEPKIGDGSHGLMQLLMRTAKGLGYGGEPGEASKLSGLYDPETNINLGTLLLARNYRLAGNWSGAVSAYNGGFRPALGFGRPAAKPLSICLARDQKTGECIRRREVPLGEYSNAAYVAAVLDRWKLYSGDLGPTAA